MWFRWKELYGDDSVCTCCETTCTSALPKGKFHLFTPYRRDPDKTCDAVADPEIGTEYLASVSFYFF